MRPTQKWRVPKMLYAKPILVSVIACSAIGFASCSSVPIATGCSELARGVLTTPTPYPEITPDTDPLIYGAQATGAITRANDDKRTGFAIIAGCEARDAEIRRQIERPWFGRLWPG